MKSLSSKNLWTLFILLCLYSLPANGQSSNSSIEQEVLTELNIVRQNPQNYVTHLEEYKKLFRGKNVEYANSMMMTVEGVKAVDEAINFLKKQAKLEPFTYSEGLAKPAQLQLNDLKENYALGHTGKDGSNPPKRIARFGKSGKLTAENIIDVFTNGKDIVMQMIIDDGVKGRGHRKNIFNKTLQQVGIAHGVGNSGPITVMVFADTFVAKTN